MEETSDVPPPSANPAPPAIPEYPKMIMDAIEALNESGGSSKTSIAQQIESTYRDLPETHASLLAHHLNSMKDSGDLAFDKNNYMKPDPNAPPKRGRGRPPKQKLPPAEGAEATPADVTATVTSPSRPRGRPPKSKDPDAPSSTATASGGSGRPRGRPPKKAKTTPASAPGIEGGSRRGRGRPPKVKPSVVPSSLAV